MTAHERTDVLVIGSGFGGAIPAYHLAAGGASVVVLERGPWLTADEFDHDFKFGSSSTRVFEFTMGERVLIGHGGSFPGHHSMAGLVSPPEEVLVVLTNDDNMPLVQLAEIVVATS